MSYSYANLRPDLFTEAGSVVFMAIRDAAHDLIRIAGAARMGEIMEHSKGSADTWLMLACVDRLVELGEIVELTGQGMVAAQHRVFVKGRP